MDFYVAGVSLCPFFLGLPLSQRIESTWSQERGPCLHLYAYGMTERATVKTGFDRSTR